MTLSRLICKSRGIGPIKSDKYSTDRYFGTEKGKCVFCGEYTELGFKPKFGNNFTSYELLQGGNVVCEYCKEIQSSQDYRRSMWYVTTEEFKTFKKKEGKEILLSKLKTPFALYFTKTWKKQGWISMSNRINENNDLFYVNVDYDTILIDRPVLNNYFELIEHLRGLKISKTEIVTGNFKSKSYEKINMDLDLISKVKENAGDPLWDLCIYLNE